jgi:hypothetical protein
VSAAAEHFDVIEDAERDLKTRLSLLVRYAMAMSAEPDGGGTNSDIDMFSWLGVEELCHESLKDVARIVDASRSLLHLASAKTEQASAKRGGVEPRK